MKETKEEEEIQEWKIPTKNARNVTILKNDQESAEEGLFVNSNSKDDDKDINEDNNEQTNKNVIINEIKDTL